MVSSVFMDMFIDKIYKSATTDKRHILESENRKFVRNALKSFDEFMMSFPEELTYEQDQNIRYVRAYASGIAH